MTSDLPDDDDSDDAMASDIQLLLEEDVDLLHRITDDLEFLIQNIDENSSTQSEEMSQLSATNSIFGDLEIASILAEQGLTKVVLDDLNTAIELLEQEQIGIEGELRLLLTSSIAEQLSEKFPLNSYFQKLNEKERVQIRQETQELGQLPGIVIKEDAVYYPLSFGTIDTYLEISNEQVYEFISDEYTSLFSQAGEMDLAVPPWRELLEELAEATSPETAQEFESLVEAATPDDLDSLDEISLALVAGARTGALQYDISKWGEDMNLASKATFSRRKSSLVDDGVITTEPVQIEVGRPRERLLINDESTDANPNSSTPETAAQLDEIESSDESETTDTNREKGEGENLNDVLDDMLRDVLISE